MATEEHQLEALKQEVDELRKMVRYERPRVEMPVEAESAQTVVMPQNDQSLMDYQVVMADIHQSIAKAHRSGHFVVVVYSWSDGRLHTDRHSHHSYDGDHELMLSELKRNLNGEAGPPDTKPLPRARPVMPKPMDVMFGKDERQDDED